MYESKTWVDEFDVRTEGNALVAEVTVRRDWREPYNFPRAADVPPDIRQALKAWLEEAE